MRARKYELKRQMTTKKLKIPPGWKVWFLDRLSRNQNWWTAIHLHPCNPALFPQTTASILLCRIFLSNLVVYMVAFDDIRWKLSKYNFCYFGRSVSLFVYNDFMRPFKKNVNWVTSLLVLQGGSKSVNEIRKCDLLKELKRMLLHRIIPHWKQLSCTFNFQYLQMEFRKFFIVASKNIFFTFYFSTMLSKIWHCFRRGFVGQHQPKKLQKRIAIC